MRQTPKLIVASGITGVTDIAHAYAALMEHAFEGIAPWMAMAAAETSGWALGISSVFALLHSIRPIGKAFAKLSGAFMWIDARLEALGNWVARTAESLLRRMLIRVASALRHIGLRLAR